MRQQGAAECRNECGGRGRGPGGQHLLPPTLSELRGGGPSLVSRLPSGEGGCAYSPGRFWTSLYGPVRSHTVQCARVILVPATTWALLPSTLASSLSLGIATPAPVLAVTGCDTAPAQSETERPVCSPVCLRPLPRRDQYNTASETRNVWRCRVLLTGNFPSTITAPATVMLVLMHISSGISRPSVAMLTSCRLLDLMSACVQGV